MKRNALQSRRRTGLSVMITVFMIVLITFLSYKPFPSNAHTLAVTEGTAVWPADGNPRQIYTLDGKWLLKRNPDDAASLQSVPSVAWDQGYGTFFLDIYFEPDDANREYNLYTRNVSTSARFLLNDTLIGEQGTYGEAPELAQPSARGRVYLLTPHAGWNRLSVQISNFVHPRTGIWDPVFIARDPFLERMHAGATALDLTMFGALVFVAFYNLTLGLQLEKGRMIYCLAAAVGAVAVGNLMRNTYTIMMFLPDIDYILVKKGSFIFYYLAAAFFFRSYKELEEHIRPQLLIFFWFSLALSLLTILLPFTVSYYISFPFYVFVFGIMSALLYRHVQNIIPSLHDGGISWWNIAHLAGDSILLYAIVHDANAVLFGRYDYLVVPIATCIFAIIHSFFLVRLRLDAQKRTDRAKSLIIHEDARIRNKLRNDLHDRLGQLTYGMEFLAESLLLSSSKDQNTIRRLRDVSQDINREIRNMLDGLGSPRLIEVGFKEAIAEMAEDAAYTYGIDVHTEVCYVPNDSWNTQAEQIYLVVREAITNACRHAEPTYITITIQEGEDILYLQVLNDGARSNLFSDHRKEGHGLEIMRQRITELGGRLHTSIRPKGIFIVQAEIPFGKADTNKNEEET
ncbi:MAG: hypothetical protein JXK93_13820 [Sphaerochaetaceae bacterium]|nr:hypothetical protein [Sphaerochaetaceae bacterium]